MLVWIIIFAISVAGAAGMLAWRGWQIKTGRAPSNSHPDYPHWDWDFKVLRGRALGHAKRYGHEAVVLFLRAWVHGAHEFKKNKEKILPPLKAKFRELFKHHAYLEGSGQPVSKFLASLNNYKKRLGKIKEKIKEDLREPENSETTPE